MKYELYQKVFAERPSYPKVESFANNDPYKYHAYIEIHGHTGMVNKCSYILRHGPILPGSVGGNIQLWDGATLSWKTIHSFVFSAVNICTVVDFAATIQHDNSDVKVTVGEIDLESGEIRFEFNHVPGSNRIEVGYNTTMPEQQISDDAKGQNSSYIDYLVDQLQITRGKLYEAEKKLNGLYADNKLENLENELCEEYNEI